MIKKKKDKSLVDQESNTLNKTIEDEVKKFFNSDNMVYSVKLNNGHEFYASLFDFDQESSCWIFENPLVGTTVDRILTLSRYEPFSMIQILNVKDVDVSTMTICSPVFTRYYWTSLKFIQQYVDTQVDMATMEMSKNLSQTSSIEASKFSEALRKYRLRSDDFNLIPF